MTACGHRTVARVAVACAAALGVLGGPWSTSDVGAEGAGSGSGGVADGALWAGVQYSEPPSPGGTDAGGCRWRPARIRDAGRQVEFPVRKVVGGITYVLFQRSCPAGSVLAWVPQPDAPTLGQDVADEVRRRLPAPLPGTAPSPDDGVVGVPTWFWTAPAPWRPVSATAWVPTPRGVLSARAAAVPVALVFVPGDGSPAVWCAGPGAVWRPELGDAAESPCSVVYRHTTQASGHAASLGIAWSITVSTSSGGSWSAGSHVTWAGLQVHVDEIQAVVTPG